jgi:hypothetical protein
MFDNNEYYHLIYSILRIHKKINFFNIMVDNIIIMIITFHLYFINVL